MAEQPIDPYATVESAWAKKHGDSSSQKQQKEKTPPPLEYETPPKLPSLLRSVQADFEADEERETEARRRAAIPLTDQQLLARIAGDIRVIRFFVVVLGVLALFGLLGEFLALAARSL